MPTHQYIFRPNGAFWPGKSVNNRLPPMRIMAKKRDPKTGEVTEAEDFVAASVWLDAHQPVEQITWAPGLPQLIRDRQILDGGWVKRRGLRCFNLYHPPVVQRPAKLDASLWLNHLRYVYPEDWAELNRAAERHRAALDFGERHGWVLVPEPFGLRALARGAVRGRSYKRDEGDGHFSGSFARCFDHPYWYRRDSRPAAIVTHLYGWPAAAQNARQPPRATGSRSKRQTSPVGGTPAGRRWSPMSVRPPAEAADTPSSAAPSPMWGILIMAAPGPAPVLKRSRQRSAAWSGRVAPAAMRHRHQHRALGAGDIARPRARHSKKRRHSAAHGVLSCKN
jgi:hypothetical protein